MITKIDLGDKWSGQNLGNQLFQVASMLGLSKRYDTQLVIPEDWNQIENFYLLPEIIIKKETPTKWIEEPYFHYDIDFFDKYEKEFQSEVVNINGVLQSEKYWKPYESYVRRALQFSDRLFKKISGEKKEIINDNTVAISVRRGDFITNPNHYLLPFEFYAEALNKYFPNYSVVIFTDDFKWCRKKFSRLSNKVFFSDKYNAIEQLCFMSMFSNFIIANSTFSWWGAYLSNKPGKKVVRPYYVFDGPLKEVHDIKDHYPEEWIIYKHKEIKRNKIVKFLFYNDNGYRIKKWTKKQLFNIYTKSKLRDLIKKLRSK